MNGYLLTPLTENISFENNMEEDIAKEIDDKKLMEIVNSLQKVAKRHHVTKKDIELIESISLSKLKDNESIKEFRR